MNFSCKFPVACYILVDGVSNLFLRQLAHFSTSERESHDIHMDMLEQEMSIRNLNTIHRLFIPVFFFLLVHRVHSCRSGSDEYTSHMSYHKFSKEGICKTLVVKRKRLRLNKLCIVIQWSFGRIVGSLL